MILSSQMMKQRKIENLYSVQEKPGFLGAGHTAGIVLSDLPYAQTDPFIVFADDQLDLPGGSTVGGAHPHGGFETLTLIVEGNDGSPTDLFEVMTAGKGIVHFDDISTETHVRLFQVWMALPPEKMKTTPFFQQLRPVSVPTIKTAEYEIRVFMGESHGKTSPMKDYTPATIVKYTMKAGAKVKERIPVDYNGLIYVVNGSVAVGATHPATIHMGEVGWLNRLEEKGESEVALFALKPDTQFVLYAARPHRHKIYPYGHFIGNNLQEIQQLYKDYQTGAMTHVDNLPAERRIIY